MIHISNNYHKNIENTKKEKEMVQEKIVDYCSKFYDQSLFQKEPKQIMKNLHKYTNLEMIYFKSRR